jgi:hypothetical protein
MAEQRQKAKAAFWERTSVRMTPPSTRTEAGLMAEDKGRHRSYQRSNAAFHLEIYGNWMPGPSLAQTVLADADQWFTVLRIRVRHVPQVHRIRLRLAVENHCAHVIYVQRLP